MFRRQIKLCTGLPVVSVAFLLCVAIACSPRTTASVASDATLAGLGGVTSTMSAAVPDDWGTIKGRVVFDADAAPAAPLVVMKGNPEVKNAEVCAIKDIASEELVVKKDNLGLRWVIVSVNRPSAIHPDLAKVEGEVELAQQTCVFKPHVLTMRQGQKLKITSVDAASHNVNLLSFKNPPFNQIMPAAVGGDKQTLPGPDLVAEQRPIKVKCDIHPWMGAWLAVFDHPYYAITDESGAFEIKNVPAGELKIVFWQEKCGWGPSGKVGEPFQAKAGGVTDIGTIKMKPAP